MHRSLLATIFLLAALAGCGSSVKLGQVEGTVRVGSQPLANVVVTFTPDSKQGVSLRSMAQADAQGHYVLKTETQRAGAAVGKHRVTIEDLSILSAPRAPDGTVLKKPPVRFSASYSDLLKTSLIKEVKPGKQTIDLEVTAGP